MLTRSGGLTFWRTEVRKSAEVLLLVVSVGDRSTIPSATDDGPKH